MLKKAIVTGASKGIGKAIALKLLSVNFFVYGIGRNFDWKHPNLETLCIDLSDLDRLPDDLKALKMDTLDALVCNVGQGRFGNLEQFSFSQIRNLMDLNFLSAVFTIKTFLPHFKKQQAGDIILIGSEAALSGKRQGSIYSATKFALRGFSQALREECARDHIRVSLINPGMVNTSFFDTLTFSPGSEASESIMPEDIAETVYLILSARKGTVFEEINLSPQKKRIVFK